MKSSLAKGRDLTVPTSGYTDAILQWLHGHLGIIVVLTVIAVVLAGAFARVTAGLKVVASGVGVLLLMAGALYLIAHTR